MHPGESKQVLIYNPWFLQYQVLLLLAANELLLACEKWTIKKEMGLIINRCPFRNQSEESINHILVYFSCTHSIWYRN